MRLVYLPSTRSDLVWLPERSSPEGTLSFSAGGRCPDSGSGGTAETAGANRPSADIVTNRLKFERIILYYQ